MIASGTPSFRTRTDPRSIARHATVPSHRPAVRLKPDTTTNRTDPQSG